MTGNVRSIRCSFARNRSEIKQTTREFLRIGGRDQERNAFERLQTGAGGGPVPCPALRQHEL